MRRHDTIHESISIKNLRAGVFAMRVLCGGLIALGLMTSAILANEWRQFRGPDGQGHAEAKNLPVVWSEQENIIWKAPVPGKGWSSPVFADGVIWLTTAVETPLTGADLEKA